MNRLISMFNNLYACPDTSGSKPQTSVNTMRTFLFSAVAATAMLATAAVGLSTDASAATRRPQYRTQMAPVIRQAPPIIRQDPYGAYNTFDRSGGRRDVNPISGTPRWNAAGGAA